MSDIKPPDDKPPCEFCGLVVKWPEWSHMCYGFQKYLDHMAAVVLAETFSGQATKAVSMAIKGRVDGGEDEVNTIRRMFVVESEARKRVHDLRELGTKQWPKIDPMKYHYSGRRLPLEERGS